MYSVIEAKLGMYDALMAILNKGKWVSWPDGNQYFVIKPEHYYEIMDPYERLLEAEDNAEKALSASTRTAPVSKNTEQV